MEIVANDPDVMDDKKIISEMIENEESPCQSSLQSPNYKLPNESVGFGCGHCRPQHRSQPYRPVSWIIILESLPF